MTDRRKTLVSAVLIIAGIVFAVIGVMRGEAVVILQKSVNICLECIGIG